MPLPVKLSEVIGVLQMPSEMFSSFVNRKNGEVLSVETEMLGLVEDGEACDESAAGGEEAYEEAKRVIESRDFVALPPPRGHDEYRVMGDFVSEIEDDNLRELFEVAISGKGAFGRFKDLAHRKGLIDAWYVRKDEAMKLFAREFLEAERIPYVES